MVSQCQTIKKLWAGHESAQTDGHTDGRTDRQTDRQSDFYIPPLTSLAGGIKIETIKIRIINLQFSLISIVVLKIFTPKNTLISL